MFPQFSINNYQLMANSVSSLSSLPPPTVDYFEVNRRHILLSVYISV